MKVCIVGSGISGLAIANLLSSKGHDVVVYEQASQIGGLIKCTKEDGNLFHRVGGHVFNSKNQEVLDWFWSFFDKGNEFLKARRQARIFIDNSYINYPIENHLYQLEPEKVRIIITELLNRNESQGYSNFADFLRGTFGTTLYNYYFKPYNEKIWNVSLDTIPLDWLEGKLPMPNVSDVFLNNILRQSESEMVHATFYYPKQNGSQFIVNRLAQNINIKTQKEFISAFQNENGWIVNDEIAFDRIVYTGDIRELDNKIISPDTDLISHLNVAKTFSFNGTSNALCYTDPSNDSWLYFPEKKYLAHRIIYTGNFSVSNNASNEKTCVVEFSGRQEMDKMKKEIAKMPGNLKPIAFNYEPNSYIINSANTRQVVDSIKSHLEPRGVYLLGRFAEWQYYNMDKCIEAAFEVANEIDGIHK